MRTVGISGRFNGLHPGHIEYIERANQEGDELVLFLGDDEYNEGTAEYLIPYQDRKKMVESIKWVDRVEKVRCAKDISKKDIDVIVAGPDWPEKLITELESGVSVIEPSQQKKYSNSNR